MEREGGGKEREKESLREREAEREKEAQRERERPRDKNRKKETGKQKKKSMCPEISKIRLFNQLAAKQLRKNQMGWCQISR